VSQVKAIAAADGTSIAAGGTPVISTSVSNPVVDDFLQREYSDPETGDSIGYNLFIPKGYDPRKSYPLVLFMHDAGATSDIVTTTLVQGLGAISWASPQDQAKREAFVLAPQFASQVVNDQSEATSLLDTTINLVRKIAGEYAIDTNRLYATGQSGGAMMTIAMNIKYPDVFAASYLVAGQWDPAKVAPLAGHRMWVVVSEGDAKAYPTENAMMDVYEGQGARVSRTVWDGTFSPAAFKAAFEKLDAEGNAINYVALKKGTVVPPGQEDSPGANHVNTWRIAYTIDEIRDWIFRQKKS
jgi:predicted peptidase